MYREHVTTPLLAPDDTSALERHVEPYKWYVRYEVVEKPNTYNPLYRLPPCFMVAWVVGGGFIFEVVAIVSITP